MVSSITWAVWHGSRGLQRYVYPGAIARCPFLSLRQRFLLDARLGGRVLFHQSPLAAVFTGILSDTSVLLRSRILDTSRGRTMSGKVWTDDRVEKLKELAHDGIFSATQIGVRLGGLTRNQVLGKCDRMGIKLTGGGCPTAVRSRNTKLQHQKRRAAAGKPRADDIARKTLADLGDNDCKFPVGHLDQPGFGFCALERVPGLPYCADHAARCYVVPNNLKSRNKDTSDVSGGRVRDASDLVSAGE